MSVNNKARSESIQQAAQQLLDSHNVNVAERVQYRPLARELAALVDCHYDTAKQHILKAVRRRRYGLSEQPQWGGARPGAGRPKDDTV